MKTNFYQSMEAQVSSSLIHVKSIKG